MVESIADDRIKDGGIYRLLHNFLEQRDYDGALRQVARYTGEKEQPRASLLGSHHAVSEFVRRSSLPQDRQRALELANEVTYPYPQAMAFREIAAGFAQPATSSAGGHRPRHRRHRELSIRRSEIPLALVAIARVQAKAGDAESAKKTLREAFGVADTRNSVIRFTPIASARLPRLKVRSAMSREPRRRSPRSRETTWSRPSRWLPWPGPRPRQATIGCAGVAPRGPGRGKGYGPPQELHQRQPGRERQTPYRDCRWPGRNGRREGAIDTIASMDRTTGGPRSWPKSPRSRLGWATSRAWTTAGSIPVPTRAGEAYSSIASLQAKSGDATGAPPGPRNSRLPTARAFALIGVTEGLAASKAEKPAGESGKP